MQAQERNVPVTEIATATESLFRSAVSTLTAKSLAIVGASERARWPSEIFKNLREFGYPGRIVLVNPRQKEVYGQRCFPSLRDLPEPVEHALVIVPAAAVAGVLTAAEETGVGSATVYASMLGDGDEPHTRQIVLFVEGIRRPQAFMHAAGRALAMGKPILAIKTGVTAQSRAASRSHTGAIAGDYAAYLAMCERYGIVNHRSLDDLVETALAFEGGRLPKGPRIAFVTTSGATVDLLYDYAAAEGAAMPDFTDATKAALLPVMQE